MDIKEKVLFLEDERKPPDAFLMQFQALAQLNPENKKAVRAMIDGMLIRHQAKKLMDTWT